MIESCFGNITGNKTKLRGYLVELSFRDSVPVEYYPVGFEACGLVELYEELLDHGSKILDDLLSVLLHPHCSCVSAWMSIHAAHNLKNFGAIH